MHQTGFALGIYTTGGGDVNVTGLGTINIDSSRIGTFNGGDVSVTSDTGDVDAGSGGSTFVIPINVFSPDGSSVVEQVYANGIVAETLRNPSAIPGGATAPGNITVWTPQGDIIANQGGIKQEALNGSAPVGPVVTLTAGTPAVPGVFDSSTPPIFVGNISLGTVGVIGETVIAQATGTITGLAVSKHNARHHEPNRRQPDGAGRRHGQCFRPKLRQRQRHHHHWRRGCECQRHRGRRHAARPERVRQWRRGPIHLGDFRHSHRRQH